MQQRLLLYRHQLVICQSTTGETPQNKYGKEEESSETPQIYRSRVGRRYPEIHGTPVYVTQQYLMFQTPSPQEAFTGMQTWLQTTMQNGIFSFGLTPVILEGPCTVLRLDQSFLKHHPVNPTLLDGLHTRMGDVEPQEGPQLSPFPKPRRLFEEGTAENPNPWRHRCDGETGGSAPGTVVGSWAQLSSVQRSPSTKPR